MTMLKSLLIGLAISVTASSLCSQPVWTAGVRVGSWFGEERLAAHPDGGLAVAWTSASGVNVGTEWMVPYPSHYKSEVYSAFSSDNGNTWSSPLRLTDPSLYSSQPDICAGSVAGDFYVTWSSGDAFSGYRHHLAHTTDFGDTWTSSSRVQAMTEPGQGILYPAIELVNGHPIVSYAGVNQELQARPFAFYASSPEIISGDWSEPTAVAPLGATVPMERTLAVGGSTAMIAGSVLSTTAVSTSPTIFVSRSENYGTSWSQPLFLSVSTSLHSQTPTVASGGNGTWVMMYFGSTMSLQSGTNIGRPYVQVSRDDGLTWTSPAAMAGDVIARANEPISVASDGNGRWVAFARANFTTSSDNGASWSAWASAPINLFSYTSTGSFSYLGSNRWGVISWQSASPAGAYLRILNWPGASVGDWILY